MQSLTARQYLPLFVPKLFTVLRSGYGIRDLRADAIAGLTVAIVALPLAMALAIASGTTPEKGLYTAIVAGFLISALGGSRVQIGGPTAAFIPVVFVVIQKFGYGGLILCTLLAGLMLIAAGLLRLGTLMKYMPQPVITGFTAGIAVSIFSSQVKDALGLRMGTPPAEFLSRWTAYAQHIATTQPVAVVLTLLGLGVILALRRWRPGWPAFLFALLVCTAISMGFALPAETIGSRFGALPSALPTFDFPHIPFERTRELLPSSFTIAFLAGVESLLSAVVADGMTGGRHRSNAELVAQGVANCASALFGGLPATGAIARTATNVRAGGRTPVAGMLHALFLLVFMLVLAPYMRYVPLAALAAVLLMVAWNISEVEAFRHTLSAPKGDRLVLLLTFFLTVFFDLTVAIEAGLVAAAFVFMFRMADAFEVSAGVKLVEENGEDEAGVDLKQRDRLPKGVEAFQISGALFFGAANRLDDLLDQFRVPPKVFILRMRLVPLIDASGVHALQALLERCHRRGIVLVISGLQPQPQRVIAQMQLHPREGELHFTDNFDAALRLARKLVVADPLMKPPMNDFRVVSALTIAGSDSGGGAGIQADLKTFAAHRVHGLSAIATLTAQHTCGVTAIEVPPVSFLRAQIDACFDDFDIGAVKLGMLATAEVIDAVADALERHRPRHVVLDPVMVATSGACLLEPHALETLRKRLLPLATLVTPNLPEAELLLGLSIDGVSAMRDACSRLIDQGARAVLLKGGHLAGNGDVVDLLADASGVQEFHHPRLQLEAHGTGCTLASAVTANLCLGLPLADACRAAGDYVHAALRGGYRPGRSDIVVLDHFGAARDG